MVNEYFERTLKVKPLILADTGLVTRINSVFEHQYRKTDLPNEVLKLGKGMQHAVFSVGKVTNPDTGIDIYIALRLTQNCPYESTTSRPLDGVLGAFENAFYRGENKPPYFVAAVVSSVDVSHLIISKPMGMLVEDISEGRSHKIIDGRIGEDFCYKIVEDSQQRFFIDPEEKYPDLGIKYCSDEARIDL